MVVRGWKMTHRTPVRILILCLGFLLLAPAGQTWAQGLDEIRQAYRDGIDAFEEGRYKDAQHHFEKVLSMRPSHELALEMREEAGYQLFVQMLARQDDLSTIARKLLELAEEGAKRRKYDPDYVRSMLEELRTADLERQIRLREEIVSQIGHFVVPHVVKPLSDRREAEWRVRVFDLLVRLGDDGVLAVMELLNHPDPFTRQNVSAVLGHMRDFRAVPALKALHESADEDTHVKEEAFRALERITGKDISELALAKEYYLALAQRYYSEHPSVMENNYQEWIVWKWKEGKLIPREVPSFAWNEEIAEELCYDALALDPNYEPMWVMLLNVLFAQKNEVEQILHVAKMADGPGYDEIALLEERLQDLDRIQFLCQSRGKELVYKALEKALKDRAVPVAVSCIRALQKLDVDGSLLPGSGADLSGMAGGEEDTSVLEETTEEETTTEESEPEATEEEDATETEEETTPTEEESEEEEEESGPTRRRTSMRDEDRPSYLQTEESSAGESGGSTAGESLCAALLPEHDKRIRYAAAVALTRLNPTRPFANQNRVVENLIGALGESGNRVALVIIPDDDTRNRIVGLLEDLGVIPFVAKSARRGLIRARAFPAEDVILVAHKLNQGGTLDDDVLYSFLHDLDADYRTKNVPTLVLVEKEDEQRVSEAVQGDAEGVVTPGVTREVMKDHLQRIFSAPRFQNDQKARAVDIARHAAEALAALDPDNTILNVRQAPLVNALVGTLTMHQEHDKVRVPALQALGNLEDPTALQPLLDVFTNRQNSTAVRVAAADAMGDIFSGGAAISAQMFVALKEALKEEDREVYRAAAQALGKADLTAEQAQKVFEEQRVE